jgi:hypothetical protein
MSARRSFAAALALVALFASSAIAQSRGRAVTTLMLDVIGPRRTGAVRASLLAHEAELEHCRGEADALVRVGFTIAPDGSVIAPTRVEDPDLDASATECVLPVVSALHFAAGAGSFTSVVWSFRLRAVATRTCWCFDWVHLGDHGLTCEPSRARCESERAATSRDHTECREIARPSCDREAFVGGHHVHTDR